MNRRKVMRYAVTAGAAGVAAGSFPMPAIAQGTIEWRMVTSWPKGLPGVGAGADRLAQRIEAMSGGRLKIQVFAAGELVPALKCMDAVMDGTAEMGHDASFYHVGKDPAFAIFFAVPFGMTADEQSAWLKFGGGQALWDELNDKFGIVAMPCGQTSAQSFGWFKKEIATPADFQGLKMRIPGLGGEVIKKMGGSAVLIAGGEIFSSLQSGAIDAAEFIGPLNDMSLGFHQVAKFCYGPGIQEPGGVVQLMVNKAKWESLPTDLQEIVRAAGLVGHEDMKVEYDLRSGETMEVLRTEHGVQFLRLNQEVLTALGKAAAEVVRESIDTGDDYRRRLWQSYLASREKTMRFLRFNEQAFLNARTLPIEFPTTA